MIIKICFNTQMNTTLNYLSQRPLRLESSSNPKESDVSWLLSRASTCKFDRQDIISGISDIELPDKRNVVRPSNRVSAVGKLSNALSSSQTVFSVRIPPN